MGSEQGAILLAEDWGDDILLIEEAFKRANITNRLLVLRTGQEVIEYFEGKGDYADRARWPLAALLLLDLMLPRLNGFEVLQWLRKREVFDGVIAVVISGQIHRESVDRAYELGANSFLAKPPDVERCKELCMLLTEFWLRYNVPAGIR